MKMNDRKKDIVKGLLMVGFSFAVVLVRDWLFPDNEILKYIALFIGAFFMGRASRLLFPMYKTKEEYPQEEESEQTDQYEPPSVRELLVLAGIMVGLSVLCFWLSELPMDVPGLAFLGLASLMVAVALLFMAMGRIKVGTDNENTNSTATEDGNEDEKTALDLFAETPLMKFFDSKKGIIVTSAVMGFGGIYFFVGPYIDPTMTPVDIAAAPYMGILCLLVAIGWPVLHKRLTEHRDR